MTCGYNSSFHDLMKYYHIVKVHDFGEEEWCLDVEKMKEIAPNIQWPYDNENTPINVSKFCVADFEFCVQ